MRTGCKDIYDIYISLQNLRASLTFTTHLDTVSPIGDVRQISMFFILYLLKYGFLKTLLL